MEFFLSDITKPCNLRITGVAAPGLEAKFAEMGVICDKEIKWLYRAPLRDPIAVEIDGYVLSLRLDEAKLIQVIEL